MVKCLELEGCTGFVRVNSGGSKAGSCDFQAGDMSMPVVYSQDNRDCFTLASNLGSTVSTTTPEPFTVGVVVTGKACPSSSVVMLYESSPVVDLQHCASAMCGDSRCNNQLEFEIKSYPGYGHCRCIEWNSTCEAINRVSDPTTSAFRVAQCEKPVYNFSCAEGEGALCNECKAPSALTADNQCITCNLGYLLQADFSCLPYACSTDATCQTCRIQSLRTADEQCEQCQPGYMLTDSYSCQAYTCATGNLSSCFSCRALSARTADHQCEACNVGYELDTQTFACRPLPCMTASSGSSCRVCEPQTARVVANNCAECNPGYYKAFF